MIGGVIYEDELLYAGHLLPGQGEDVYLGYLMVEPKRHVSGWGNLTDEEASALGQLANDLGRALRDSEAAEHIYSFVLGDAVPHLHMHVVPRYPGAPTEYWGVRVDEWPGAPRGGAEAVTSVCNRLRRQLRRMRHADPG